MILKYKGSLRILWDLQQFNIRACRIRFFLFEKVFLSYRGQYVPKHP